MLTLTQGPRARGSLRRVRGRRARGVAARAGRRSAVVCNRGCGRTWPRDPVLEVPCPRCGAPVGSPCTVLRPSGHRHSAAFSGLPPWGHDERDLAAYAAGAYGRFPLGRCGPATQPPPADTQTSLF